jgi:heptosyltransferase-2
MSLPALKEIRRVFSEAHLTLAVRSRLAELFDGEGLADEIMPIDGSRDLFRSIARFVSDARRARRARFDFAVLLPNSFQAALLARASGIRAVAGYPTDGRRLLISQPISLAGDHKTSHQAHYYLRIVSEIERALRGESRVDLEDPRPRLRASEKSIEDARRLLSEHGVTAGKIAPGDSISEKTGVGRAKPGILALNPGATNSRAKRWLPERFAATADRLSLRDGFQTIIVGASGDAEAASQVTRHMRTPSVNLTGRTSLSDLKGVLALSSMVISNDTGTAHVASALGVPTVVVFGPTEDVSTRPLSDAAVVVRHRVECSPCMLRDCPIDHRCMTGVQIEDVLAAADKLLAVSFSNLTN